MTVTIPPALEDKIGRRARRAFNRFDEGVRARYHRISDLKQDRLKYRVPRSGRKLIEVVRAGHEIIVDPPTTGLIDLLSKADLSKLKNTTGKIHAGPVTAYLLSDKEKKVGKLYKKADKLLSRAQCVEQVKLDQHVYVVDLKGDTIENVALDHLMAGGFTITGELDPVKDLGFTDGLIDVLTKDDLKRLRRHMGEIRAYMVVAPKTSYKFPATYRANPDPHAPLMSREQCIDSVKEGGHVLVVETDYDDTTLGETEFTSREFEVTAELDPEKDLGFTTGLFDLLTKDDVISLRKKRHLGRVRAYKFTSKDAESPYQTPKIKYEPGKDYEIKDADTDPDSYCHKGINVANLDWAKRSTTDDRRLFAFEFEMADVAAIPTNTDGKFRVHRCKCVEELDPKTLKPIKPTPRSPQDDLDDLVAPSEESEKVSKEPPKKRGLFGKLFGRDNAE